MFQVRPFLPMSFVIACLLSFLGAAAPDAKTLQACTTVLAQQEQELVARRRSRKKKKRKKRRKKSRRDKKRTLNKPAPAQAPEVEQTPDADKPELEDVPSSQTSPENGGWQSEPALVPGRQGPASPAGNNVPLEQPALLRSDEPESKRDIVLPETRKKPPEKDRATEKGDLGPSVSAADFLLDVGGEILLQRGGRVDPGADLEVGWNLGKILGWPGLYLAAGVDIFIGDSPLGAKYLLMDTGAGFMGRFPLGPVNLRATLEFELRKMFITSQGSSGDLSPSLGLGFGMGLDLDFALTRWLLIVIGGSAKLVQDPMTGKFEFSAVARGGVGFAF